MVPNSQQSKTVVPLSSSLDTVFTLLSNRRRRCVLYLLAQAEEPVELSELARLVGVYEHGGETPAPDELKRIYSALYNTHVPKLANAGLVEYDDDGDSITAQLATTTPVIAQYLEQTARVEFEEILEPDGGVRRDVMTCDYCEADSTGSQVCSYCGETYCADHRWPEAHDCDGLDNWVERGGRFESGFGGFRD